MNKILKITALTAAGLAAAGGVAVGTYYIVKAANDKEDVAPLPEFKDGDVIFDGMTLEQLTEELKSTGAKESNLLAKVNYQIAFKLYEEEQEASYKMQEAWFNWDQYSARKTLLTTIYDQLQVSDVNGTNVEETLKHPEQIIAIDYDAFYDFARIKAQEKRDQYDKDDADESADWNKFDGIYTKLEDQKETFVETKSKIEKVQNKSIDFDDSDFASDYPRVLQPLDKVREKQSQAFDDTKNGFVDSFATKQEGLAEWQKELVSKYDGATSKEEALDYLTFQQVSSKAFARFSYSLNSTFSVEQIGSGAFSEYLGEFADVAAPSSIHEDPADDDSKVLVFVNKDQATTPAWDESVYFMGTGSNVAEHFNVTANIGEDLNKLTQVENTILGVVPGQAPTDPWGFAGENGAQDILKRLLRVYSGQAAGRSDLISGVDNFQEVYAGPNADPESDQEKLTQLLVAHTSGMADSSSWEKGNLGWKETIQHGTGSVEGYAIGYWAAVYDMRHGSDGTTTTPSTAAADQPATLLDTGVVDAPSDYIAGILALIKDGFTQFVGDNGYSLPNVDGSSTPSEIADYNTLVERYISMMTDIDVNKYMGEQIRDYMNGKFPDGLPSAVRIQDGVYSVINSNFGMHIIRINDNDAAIESFESDMQEIADDQDPSSATTDYASLISGVHTDTWQLQTLLDVAIPAGETEYAFTNDQNEFLTLLEENIEDLGDYQVGEMDRVKSDILAIITGRHSSETLEKVDAGLDGKFETWLEAQIDNEIFAAGTDTQGDHVLQPEEIYNLVYNLEVGQ